MKDFIKGVIIGLFLVAVGFGVWYHVSEPRRNYEEQLDKGIQAYKERARQEAKAELKKLLDRLE